MRSSSIAGSAAAALCAAAGCGGDAKEPAAAPASPPANTSAVAPPGRAVTGVTHEGMSPLTLRTTLASVRSRFRRPQREFRRGGQRCLEWPVLDAAGGILPGQWYRLCFDGQDRLRLKTTIAREGNGPPPIVEDDPSPPSARQKRATARRYRAKRRHGERVTGKARQRGGTGTPVRR